MLKRILFATLAVAMLTVGVSCTTAQKNTAKEQALEVAANGLGGVVSTALSCSNPEGVKSYLKEKFADYDIFKPEAEGGTVVPANMSTQSKKGVGGVVCSIVVATLYDQLKTHVVSQTLLQRGSCTLDDVGNLTQSFLLEQCQKIKF